MVKSGLFRSSTEAKQTGYIQKKLFLYVLLGLWLLSNNLAAQRKRLAITIDDMPFNAMPSYYTLQEARQVNETLLAKINLHQTPITAFFVGNNPLSPTDTTTTWALLRLWANSPFVTLANHTFSHFHFAETPQEDFEADIMKNEGFVKQVVGDVKMKYFRFPYNCLGKDSLSQTNIALFLKAQGYVIAPFTFESADYVYNALYGKALQEGNLDKASEIAAKYLDFTAFMLAFSEQLAEKQFQKDIGQIYLCHANPLNADYFDQLIELFKQKGYALISLDEILQEPIYAQKNHYYKKWGISWLYRWIEDDKQRSELLKTSPDPDPKDWDDYQKLTELK